MKKGLGLMEDGRGTLHKSRPSLGTLNLRAEALDLRSLATEGTQESKNMARLCLAKRGFRVLPF